MNILVLGATGGTGRQVVEQALARGWQVTALVRNPDKLPAAAGLRVVAGQVTDATELAAVMPGQNAVLSTLGHNRHSGPTILVDGAAATTAAMSEHGVRRLVFLSGAGAKAPGDDPRSLVLRAAIATMGLIMPSLVHDSQDAADLVRATDLDWTVVRPMRLTDGDHTRPVEADPHLHVGMTEGIDRRELAGFLLDLVGEPRFVRESPIVRAQTS